MEKLCKTPSNCLLHCMLLATVVPLLIPMLFLVVRVCGEDKRPIVASEPLKTLTQAESQEETLSKEAAADYIIGNFTPSLAMKERIDFLLSPALLVQDAICEDTVLTYPQE